MEKTSTGGLNVVQLTVRHEAAVAAVDSVSLDVQPGELVLVLGRNGAGKSSLLKALMGEIPSSGGVTFAGERLHGLDAAARAHAGVRLVRDHDDAFSGLTVRENILLGLPSLRRNEADARLASVLVCFPELRARLANFAGTLSGGELRKLSLARAMFAEAHLFLLDEPSGGLSPRAYKEALHSIVRLSESGACVLLAEQSASHIIDLADRVLVMEGGKIVAAGSRDDPLSRSLLESVYLGGAPC